MQINKSDITITSTSSNTTTNILKINKTTLQENSDSFYSSMSTGSESPD